MWSELRQWARALKRDTVAVYLAVRDERTPWLAKAIGIVIVAYALSPIDLLPDFIPVLGYLDDVLLIPVGLWIVIKLIPEPVMAECRLRADALPTRPVSGSAAIVIVGLWVGVAALAAWPLFSSRP